MPDRVCPSSLRFVLLSVLAAALCAPAARAVSSFRASIPNGATIGCTACHENGNGGEGWNAFGLDVMRQDPAVSDDDFETNNQNRNYTATPAWTSLLCGADSDDDGATNGQELGDPTCSWTPGHTPARTTDLSAPGDPDSLTDNPTGVDPSEGEGEGEGEDDPHDDDDDDDDDEDQTDDDEHGDDVPRDDDAAPLDGEPQADAGGCTQTQGGAPPVALLLAILLALPRPSRRHRAAAARGPHPLGHSCDTPRASPKSRPDPTRY